MAGVDILLNNASAAAGVDITGEWITWSGGPGDFWVWGDLGGGEIHLEAALDKSAPLEVCLTRFINITTIASGVSRFDFNHGTSIRAVVAGTTGTSSGIFAKVN